MNKMRRIKDVFEIKRIGSGEAQSGEK